MYLARSWPMEQPVAAARQPSVLLHAGQRAPESGEQWSPAFALQTVKITRAEVHAPAEARQA